MYPHELSKKLEDAAAFSIRERSFLERLVKDCAVRVDFSLRQYEHEANKQADDTYFLLKGAKEGVAACKDLRKLEDFEQKLKDIETESYSVSARDRSAKLVYEGKLKQVRQVYERLSSFLNLSRTQTN